MKKLIFIILLLAFFSGGLAAEEVQDFAEFVRDVKEKIIIERSYQIETEEELVLAPGQAARLNFKENPAGVAEIIFFYDNETMHIIFGYPDDTENRYDGTELNLERKKSFRGIRSPRATQPLWVFYGFEPKDGKTFVKFRATEQLSEKDQEEINEIDEARRRRKAAELQAISELAWDFEEKNKPLKIIMDDPNDPNMVELRKKYDLEGLVSGAQDDYEKLRLITARVQKQWRHHGNNKPSKSDPLTILKEASEGKRFRCVEYAIVVVGCTRSLGMPSRKLALKRPDVETAKSGAGHVVAEVWLKQFNKWVFADGQYGAIPEVNGVPLNAVEFQDAIACESPGLRIRFATKGDEKNYLAWVARYLYYFDFNLDQRFYAKDYKSGKVMLVPKGAKKPKVFQRKTPIKNCTYISNPKAFYPQMSR